MDINVKISSIFTFLVLFFSGFKAQFDHMPISILPVAQLQAQLMTSQIRSHRQIRSYKLIIFLCSLLYSKLMKNLALLAVFNTI